jgi:N-terminal domain of galactosyltransferase
MRWLRAIWNFFVWLLTTPRRRSQAKGKGVSIITPFRPDNLRRQQTWDWLSAYYRYHLPKAEFITCTNDGVPFCKTAAFNDGVRQAHGDIFVLLDADCYMRHETILTAAKNIRAARKHGEKLWYIPYRRFYRITNLASWYVLTSTANDPFEFKDPPRPDYIEERQGNSQGHWFGALCQIMPREAYEEVGGMDERFAGWGGEDLAFMRAVDTLWAKHKTLDVQILHLHHPKIGTVWTTRRWEGQETAGSNNRLADRYYGAVGDRRRMRKLVEEGKRESSQRCSVSPVCKTPHLPA